MSTTAMTAVGPVNANITAFETLARKSQETKRVRINPVAEHINTLIGEGSKFIGDMELKDGIKLDGDVRGNIRFGIEDGLAVISRRATLEGSLIGPRAVIMGTIEGNVYISGLLLLSPSAIVLGDIYAERLVVHDGAQVGGAMHMGKPPSEDPVVKSEGSFPNQAESSVVRPLFAAG